MSMTKAAGVLAAALLASALMGGAALAQEADDEIVITGSRIRTSPLQNTQPVITLGEEEMAKSGLTAPVDLLQRLPIAGGGLNTKFNNSGNFGNPPDGGGVGAGAAEIDLRFLGSRRTLVLVDGMRWVNAASASGVPGSVDLNTIPSSMIGRIEVLQEGASPIYGSDAIAGVVNIITKDRQDGLQVSAQVGGYEDGDGFAQDYMASWGINEGSTAAVLGVNYSKQDGVLSADRETTFFPTPGATACDSACSSGTPRGRFIISDPNTLQDLNLTLRAPLAPGVVPTYIPGDPTSAAGSFQAFTTADRFNFQPFNYVVTPSEKLGLFGQISHDFSSHLRLRVRGSYSNRKSENQAAPLPLFVGPDAGNGNLLDTVSVDATNPFNPFGFTLTNGTYAFIGRRLVEAGPRNYKQDVNTFNLTGTLGGDITLLGRDLTWDVNAVWSRNRAEQTFTGNVNAQRVQQALGPVAQCTGSCVPLNIFGGAGTITPAQLAFIGFTQQDTSEQELVDYSANLTGDLFTLPAGPVGFAVGYEHRRSEGFFQPDAVVVAGLSADIPAQPTRGDISADEAYLEVSIPLIARLPFIQSLDASLAARIFDYDAFGSDETFKAGLVWRPVDDILVRGSFGEGFRAPSIGELFGTASRFDQEVTDPCSNFLGLNGGTAQPLAVQQNCIARGVPANGSYVQLNPQLSVITSGNQALTPETSEALNVGIVWDPNWFEGLSWTNGMTFELNYADIQLENAIQAQNGQALLSRCATTNDPVACATITRTASGQVSAIANPLINIGGIDTQAVDLTVTWTSPDWSFGTFQVRSATSHLIEFTEFVPTGSGLVGVAREGTERGSPDQAYPEWKSTFTVDWSKGGWGATGTARYISSVDEAGAANTLDNITYFDAQVRWSPARFGESLMFSAGINNITDEDPPGCFTCGLNNYDPTTYDAPGRYGYLRLAYKP
jgi:iron complex outermembrane recepter protein